MDERSQPRPGAARREFRHPDEVLEFLEGIRERARRDAERHQRYTDQAGGVTGVGSSADGSVRAEVDGQGIVSRLDIPDSALRRGNYLATMVLTAIREAQAARALKLAGIGAELTGARVVEMVREAIPEQIRDGLERRPDNRW